MTTETELFQNNQTLKRKIIFWRILSMFALFITIVTIAIFSSDSTQFEKTRDHIARISVSGVLSDEYSIADTLLELQTNPNVKGVIVYINSPGGSTFAGESLYNELQLLSKEKPLVAQIGAYGASGGYLVALAADHIIAQRNSITGSIGVAVELIDTGDFLEKVGVNYDSVKSSPLKDQPNMFEQASEESILVLEELVNDTYEWFIEIVAERRSLSIDEARRLGDGRIFNGNQALNFGLIDEIGNGREVLNWIDKQFDTEAKLPVVNWETNQNKIKLTLSDFITSSISEFVRNTLLSSLGLQSDSHSGKNSTKGLVSILQFPIPNSSK